MQIGASTCALLATLAGALLACSAEDDGAHDAALARGDAAARGDAGSFDATSLPPRLLVRTPAADETWFEGSTVSITWRGAGDVAQVDITLIVGGTLSDQVTLASGVANSGEHSVQVGAWRGEQARVRVSSTTAPDLFADSGPFLILPQIVDFKRQLFGEPGTLTAFIADLDVSSGRVTIGGGDARAPSTPFSFEWGDGSSDETWFDAEHTYSDTTGNYLVTVTAHYGAGAQDTREVPVRFVAPQLVPRDLPPELAVTIPDHQIELESRFWEVPTMSWFADSDFGVVPRSVVEYLLSAAAHLQHGFCNGDVFPVGAGFQQVVLRDTYFSDIMYSLWFTTPVGVAATHLGWGEEVAYSSLFHEMGHNFTLNSPAHFHYGGRIDSNANAIFSEAMAQIFQAAAAFALLNRAGYYGLEPTLAEEVTTSARRSLELVRSSYEELRSGASSFSTWNDPATPHDETFQTFMTVAYKFFEHAELQGRGYGAPLRRMMHLLQGYNEQWQQSYAPQEDSTSGEAFRSTLMVTALSYAFAQDLRPELRALGFPVDDATYDMLYADALARLE